ncbi:unnamed protein product [Arctogadus glacialis]
MRRNERDGTGDEGRQMFLKNRKRRDRLILDTVEQSEMRRRPALASPVRKHALHMGSHCARATEQNNPPGLRSPLSEFAR